MTGHSARPKLVEPTGYASPERAELALAIAARAAAVDVLTRLEAAQAGLDASMWDADADVVAAEHAVEEAHGAAAELALAAATGATVKPALTLAEARAQLQERQDAYAAARRARASLPQCLDQAQRDAAEASRRVQAAALAVMATSPAVMATEGHAVRLQAEFLDQGLALLWLMRKGILEVPGGPSISPDHPLRDRWGMVRFLEMQPLDWAPNGTDNCNRDRRAFSPTAIAWEAALEALQLDANAVLPE